ncbi:MAG: GNAT family N-acetyltransferase [Brevundimonas sp.]|jgi:putative acetyltransferase|uniref:GNAT family N-acetyltransferase n=1 Tax=Brevundimonas sp. TaxID=1871086 RepID=UPI003918AC23
MSVTIRDFVPHHGPDWRRLNEAWLRDGGFAIEARDQAVLDDPQGAILARGGHIFMAEIDREAGSEAGSEVVGCCALLDRGDGETLELAKMTVSAAHRGRGIGMALLHACERRARESGHRRLYLETNSSLRTAIALYERFGFRALAPQATDYARCDVWMEKRL